LGAHARYDGIGIAVRGNLELGRRVTSELAVHIAGSEGRIEVPWLWVPRRSGNRIIVHRPNGEPMTLAIDAPADVYALEADVVAAAIAGGLQEPPAPAMNWADTLGNMQTLDRWREAINLKYGYADEA
jgi:hypothetical protein